MPSKPSLLERPRSAFCVQGSQFVLRALLCVVCYADLVVDLYVPPGFAAPRRVSPQGAFWSASQSMLRWPLGTVGQGAAGVVVAAFRVKGGAEAAAAGLARCHAVLKLQGEGGSKERVVRPAAPCDICNCTQSSCGKCRTDPMHRL
jgi:hypothetical protein